jgi:hypothetical protein
MAWVSAAMVWRAFSNQAGLLASLERPGLKCSFWGVYRASLSLF